MSETTSITDSNRAVVARLYDAVVAGDTETIEATFAEDCVAHMADGHPVSGALEGRDTIMSAMGEAFATMRNTGTTIHELLADGPSKVVALVDTEGLDSQGDPYAMPVAEVFTVKGDQVVEIRPYYWDLIELRRLVSG